MATKKPKPPFSKPKNPPKSSSKNLIGARLGRGAAAHIPTLLERKPARETPAQATSPPEAAPQKQTENAKTEAEAIVARIEELRTDIASNFYQMGRELRDLRRPERYSALGYKSFKDALEGRALLSFPQARKLIRIVDAFTEPVARRYGVEKTAEIIRLAEHRGVPPIALLREDPELDVDDERTGRRTKVRLTIIKHTHLATFVNTLINPANKPGKDRVQRLSRALSRALDTVGIDPDRVRTIRRRSGTHVVRIELPPDEAEDLLAFVKKHRD